jgi:hypothetical protein
MVMNQPFLIGQLGANRTAIKWPSSRRILLAGLRLALLASARWGALLGLGSFRERCR